MQVQVQDVGFGYSPYPHELSRDPSVSLQAKGLFAVYGSFVSVNDPTAWPSENYLCRLCGGLNEKTFRKYKRELLNSGWISQVQRHRENGQYTTLLVTRYYHPSMNPFLSMKSTDDQKTDDRKTDDRKLVPQEQKTLSSTKKHTQTKASVCVSSDEQPEPSTGIPEASTRASRDWQDLDQFQRECIEWVIDQYRRQGQLKNEIGLRCELVKSAKKGELDTSSYLAMLEARKRANKAISDAVSREDESRQSVENDPITPEFWKEMKKQHRALFV